MEYTLQVFLFFSFLKTRITNFWFYMCIRFKFIKKSHFFSSWIFVFTECFASRAPRKIIFHVKDYDQNAAKRVVNSLQ